MNEQVDTAEYEFLWKLLANPADPNHSYIFSLQSLVSDFPQSGVLRALLMPNGDKKHLKHAAAYFNPRVLHKLATAPDSLAKVNQDQIVFSDEPEEVVADTYFNLPVTETFEPPITESADTAVGDDSVEEFAPMEVFEPEVETSYNGFSEPQKTLADHYIGEPIADQSHEEIAYLEDGETQQQSEGIYTEEITYVEEEPETHTSYTALDTGTAIEEDPIHEEIAEAPIVEQVEIKQPEIAEEAEESLAQQYDAYLAESEAAPVALVSSYESTGDRYFHQPIEDEVYDEIVSIEDIGLEQLAILNKAAAEGGESYFVFEPEIAEPASGITENVAPITEDSAAEQQVPEPVTYPAVEEKQVSPANLHPVVIANAAYEQQARSFDAKRRCPCIMTRPCRTRLCGGWIKPAGACSRLPALRKA
ncbi:hypothetical protein [Mucilaginibacter antarcticus]|uniref:hypothetical protein n=1 Tax=Mucilaginibacter antarcticus TaxID=1855725 RepID=UPI0036314187